MQDEELVPPPRPPSRPGAGRHLILIGLAAVIALVLGLAALLQLSLRHIDATVRQDARADAFRGAQFIRDRLLLAAREQGPGVDLENAGGDWLGPLLGELKAEDSRLSYAMVVSPTGQVIVHSDPGWDGQELPPVILDRIMPPVITGEWESVVDWPELGQVLDMSLPVDADGQELGTIHLGIRQEALARQVARSQAMVPVILTLTCLLCLAILAGTLVNSGLAIRRARRATQRVAQATHRAQVGALASGLAHEIRNPLNAMRMQVALIRRKLAAQGGPASPGAVTTTLDHLEGEVTRLQNLASEFLDFGRSAQAGAPWVDLRQVLRESAEFLAPEFEQAGLSLMLELPEREEPVNVAVDRGRLRQVVLNLAANARAAMASGGRLTLSLQRRWRQAVLRISDTGDGIDAKTLPHIFDVFYTTRPGGTGLGLTIVRQIVEDAGGHIRVTSGAGAGATFEITLPLARRHAPAAQPVAST